MMKKNVVFIALLLLLSAATFAQSDEQSMPRKRPTPEERLKRVAGELDKNLVLSSVQKKKIIDAYKSFFTEMDKNIDKTIPPPPPPPVSKEIAEKLSGERDAKIKGVLTAEQYAKYVEIEKQLRPKRFQKGCKD